MLTHDAEWSGLSASALALRCAVPRAEVLAETDSTLDVAHALAEQGAPAGLLVVADSQRAGRGRPGRTWRSPPGSGIWCTVVERPRDAGALEVLSLRVGLRAAEALDGFAGERVGVKWPNDLVLRAGKLGGILTEARWTGASLAWVAIGVGVNVIPPPPPPVGVEGAAGMPPGVQRADVLTAIVAAIRSAAAATGALTSAELERYRARDVLVGRRIIAPATGTVVGLAASGALIVETPAGREEHRAGTIQFAEKGEGETEP